MNERWELTDILRKCMIVKTDLNASVELLLSHKIWSCVAPTFVRPREGVQTPQWGASNPVPQQRWQATKGMQVDEKTFDAHRALVSLGFYRRIFDSTAYFYVKRCNLGFIEEIWKSWHFDWKCALLESKTN